MMSSGAFNQAANPNSARTDKLYPLSFRVTAAEKAKIKDRAKGRSVSAYLRDVAIKGKASSRKGDMAIKVDMAARVLAALGQSDLFSNLSTIADASESGALPVTEELEAELRSACALIIAMRCDLIEALGIKDRI